MTSRRSAIISALPIVCGSAEDSCGFDEEWDVVVVGTGVAGLAAALEARKAGASVLLLEKMGSIGGNSVLSDGQVAVPGTPMQQNCGIEDSEELFYKDLRRLGEINHPWRVRTLAREALRTFEWTKSEFGVQWIQDKVEYDFGQSVSRCALLLGGSSLGLVYPMLERVKSLGVKILLHHKAERLILHPTDDLKPSIAGITASHQNSDGKTSLLRIRAKKGVVVCSGGFGADIKLRQMQNWRLSDVVGTTTHPGSTSEMLRECARIGAWTVHMEYIHCTPESCPEEKGWGSAWRFSRYCAAYQGVWVVQETGRRFVNELGTNAVRTNAVLDEVNKGLHCIAIADASAVEHPSSVIFNQKDVERLAARGLVHKFDSLEHLAAYFNVPLEPLKNSIEKYNQDVSQKKKSDSFGRHISNENKPMARAPWYACRILPKVLVCGGGLVIDEDARVLSVVDDKPIEGLFAAGEATGGLHGIARLTSCGIIDALVFGRIAGKKAAERSV